MNALYLYDDAKARQFEPFSLTRPISELRVGAEITRLRWERVANAKARGFIAGAHLDHFAESNSSPSVARGSSIPSGSIIVNSRFIPSLGAVLDERASVFVCDGIICAVRSGTGTDVSALADGAASLEALADPTAEPSAIAGRWLAEVWDLVGLLPVQLREDITAMSASLSAEGIGNATCIGGEPILCERGASMEPFVVLDASDGPILIRRGARIASFTRIVGPCYIGEDSHVLGDTIRGCSIGDVCRVHGEMASTVMVGHANKSHAGFVGHSYIGRWANLGAGTTTSNLKNTYGAVRLSTAEGSRDTGMQMLGSLIGDHAKLGIGSMLTTGCVVGAGANIFGRGVTPKRIPPFAWGDHEPYDRFDFGKFIEIAERVMARRHVTLSLGERQKLEEAYRESGITA